ncbi:MAG TPA: hypothetical protein VM261_36970 [Kofleriaceae bacterium]|nr:hypothetical protein [Kofleriaceae bacterium]
MWWIKASVRRESDHAVVAVVATLFTLVGCGGTSLRRPLVTDATPLGTSREQVLAWHRDHGWCPAPLPPEVRAPAEIVFMRPCDEPDRYERDVALVFTKDDHLAQALVTVSVPDTVVRRSAWEPRGATEHRLHGNIERRNVAIDIMDGLADELEARYGAPDVSTWTERTWATRNEYIRLAWNEIVDGRFVVTEEHHPLERVRGPLSTVD